MTEVFLPRSPLSSSICSDRSRRRILSERPASARSSVMPAATAERRIFWRWPMTPCASARSRTSSWLACSRAPSPLILATRPFWAETGITCSLGRPRISAEVARCRSIWPCTCAGVLSESHIVSILLRTTRRESVLSASVTRCSRQIDRSDLVTPVSAASMKTTAWACGIRLTVNSGSAPMAFSPGVSRITSPCLSSGWAMLIRAWRHRVVLGRVVVPKTQRPGFVLRDVAHLGDLFESRGQLAGIVDVEIHAGPLFGDGAPFHQRLGLQPRLDRQQAQAGRHAGVPTQLGRAHRGAAGARGHDAALVAGEEDRVDQLRLAAGELGDESHHHFFGAQLRLQPAQTLLHRGVEQVMVLQPLRQRFQPQRELAPPRAMLVELLVEGSAHYAFEYSIRPQRGPYDFWQFGQKYVARWPWRILFTGVPQIRHGSPARSYTIA